MEAKLRTTGLFLAMSVEEARELRNALTAFTASGVFPPFHHKTLNKAWLVLRDALLKGES